MAESDVIHADPLLRCSVPCFSVEQSVQHSEYGHSISVEHASQHHGTVMHCSHRHAHVVVVTVHYSSTCSTAIVPYYSEYYYTMMTIHDRTAMHCCGLVYAPM